MGRGASVTLAGSTAFQPFAENLAEAFNAAHPDVNVTVQGGGSAVGISAALNGAAQIGMADLVELPADAKNLTAFVVARDGIAVVVNPSNEVGDLPMSADTGCLSRQGQELEGARRSRRADNRRFPRIGLGDALILRDDSGTLRPLDLGDYPGLQRHRSRDRRERRERNRLPVLRPPQREDQGGDRRRAKVHDGAYPRREVRLVRPIYLLTLGEPAGNVQGFHRFCARARRARHRSRPTACSPRKYRGERHHRGTAPNDVGKR